MHPSDSPTLMIDVISDVVCPWCFVGKRRLDEALSRLRSEAALQGDDPIVRWHPFELNPDLPRDGIDRATYLERKFGPAQSAATIYERVRAAGASTGIVFRFDRIARQPNTRDAHRLIEWVQGRNSDASPLMERLFTAYFCEGRSLVGVAALADLASETGFDHDEVLAYLESEAGTSQVSEAERRAQAIGVTGVPFFIFNRRIAISGAQSTELLLQAIAKAREEPAHSTA